MYPDAKPCDSFTLDVGDGHRIAVSRFGDESAPPVLFIHGGPGGGTPPGAPKFFDLRRWHLITFDQRGCGQSQPRSCLEANTTDHLVRDMEAIRDHLGIPSWVLFGGSWGSTLALSYASQHRQRVNALILRGIFLCTEEELRWLYENGAAQVFPAEYDQFLAPIGGKPQPFTQLLASYYRLLTSDDPRQRQNAADAWAGWENHICRLRPEPASLWTREQNDALARLECHYFVNRGFLGADGALLDAVGRLRDIPAVIIHGRYDMVCPARSAWRLSRAWPEAQLEFIDAAGHAASETSIARRLVAATDHFAAVQEGRPVI